MSTLTAVLVVFGAAVIGIGSIVGAFRFSWSEFKSLWNLNHSFSTKEKQILFQGFLLGLCFLQLQVIAALWIEPKDEEFNVLRFVAYGATLGPIIEELVFRGLFLKAFEKRIKLGVFLSSVFFGLLHYPMPVAPVFLGFFNAQIRLRTKSLLYPILAHIATNLFSFGLAYVFFNQTLQDGKVDYIRYGIVLLITAALLFKFRKNLKDIFWFSEQKKVINEIQADVVSSEPAPLAEGEDYYMENGYMVFTEKYHLKRGYCCASGCRHCPYRKKV